MTVVCLPGGAAIAGYGGAAVFVYFMYITFGAFVRLLDSCLFCSLSLFTDTHTDVNIVDILTMLLFVLGENAGLPLCLVVFCFVYNSDVSVWVRRQFAELGSFTIARVELVGI